jgi:hypothetical protein
VRQAVERSARRQVARVKQNSTGFAPNTNKQPEGLPQQLVAAVFAVNDLHFADALFITILS